MSNWNPFDRGDKPPEGAPLDDDERFRLEAKRDQLQKTLGIDDEALRRLRRKLELDLAQLRGKK